MRKLDKIDLEKKRMAMRVRAALRLKAQEQYLEDLNEVLPDALAAFDKKTKLGELPKPLDVKRALGA